MAPRHGRGPGGIPLDFDIAPFLVIWETTQACDLACKHCRAEAQPDRNPDELTTAEAKRMIDDVRRFGPIVFVFSGGDCLKRPDIVELVEHAASLDMKVGVTPATTDLCTVERMRELKDAGLARLAVSLDGSCPEIHDSFRQVDGSFDHGLRILKQAREIGLSTQVNTVVGPHNLEDFDDLCDLMGRVGITLWEVFCLVPIGRATIDDVAGADAFEEIFHRLYDLSKTAPFDIKVTAAPQYNRVVLQRKTEEKREGLREESGDVLTDGAHHSRRDGIGRGRNVNDADGFLFVSHTGEIYPSGFMPVSAGNVRHDDLVDVYQSSSLFTSLRDRDGFKGKCGVCEFRKVCGGSRSRAWAVTGDPIESEPFCAWVPARWNASTEAATMN
ncbi:MAG: TIGR04053 family radical SAM/SPASM domain-containing protein [Gemmatimonadota bacterium]|nr:TIGR04053 family radical SAM/SPASM domain-containing protein [Gemmatimonadota bacterium]